jgi:hypothetical protein
MIIPRQSINNCHPQEFCVQAIGDKIIVKSHFYVTCHISLSYKLYIVYFIEV